MSAGTRKSPKPKNITVVFDHEGVQSTTTFPGVVTAADADRDTTRIEARNAQRWEIAGTGWTCAPARRMIFTKE